MGRPEADVGRRAVQAAHESLMARTVPEGEGIPFPEGGMHPSWSKVLDVECLHMLDGIGSRIGPDTHPDRTRILRFLSTDLDRIRVVILGQDPYPAAGAATGRAFEVGGLTSWLAPFRQVSLKNMLRAIHAACMTGEGESLHVPVAFSEIRRQMQDGSFRVLPPDRLFTAWEAQGVLLLNTALSIHPGEPGSHSDIWKPFTERVLARLSDACPGIHWFIWGAHAARFLPCISKGVIHASRHPMMCSPDWEDDFLKNRCFLETASIVDWTGMSVVQ